MIKKFGVVVFSFLLAFFVLEGLASLHKDDCKEKGGTSFIEGAVAQCPYKYKPYKNVVYDFISKEISTKFDAKEYEEGFVELGDADLHPEEGVVLVKPEVEVVKAKPELPKIAIVIDDMGISDKRTRDIMSLNAPITLSFLTYSRNLDGYFEMLKGGPFEVMAHIPMEAKTKFDEAPDTLRVSFSDKEVEKKFSLMLEKYDNIAFVNNHTGSLFTENAAKMDVVMKVLKEKGVGFLDSRTSSKSVGKIIANKHGVKYLGRNVFLDNKNDFEYIMGQLRQTEKMAKKYGSAIAIAHPKSQTYEALKHWLATQKDFEIVTLSNL